MRCCLSFACCGTISRGPELRLLTAHNVEKCRCPTSAGEAFVAHSGVSRFQKQKSFPGILPTLVLIASCSHPSVLSREA
jgi:hypothetical protein